KTATGPNPCLAIDSAAPERTPETTPAELARRPARTRNAVAILQSRSTAPDSAETIAHRRDVEAPPRKANRTEPRRQGEYKAFLCGPNNEFGTAPGRLDHRADVPGHHGPALRQHRNQENQCPFPSPGNDGQDKWQSARVPPVSEDSSPGPAFSK